MSGQALFVLFSLIAMILILAFDKMRPGLTLLSFVVLFMAGGIITPSEVTDGFSNRGMITIAMLFLVSEGVRQTGALNRFIGLILPPKSKSVGLSLLRIVPSIATISAFLNNTAVVIIFAPIIKKWAQSLGRPASKFLIPLSYATIFGGICTLIGTSTNLVVHGMMIENGFEGFSMFELGRVGIFIAIAGIIYLVIFGNRLLPDGDRDIKSSNSRDFYYDVIVVEGSRFIGERIEKGKTRLLPQLYITTIKRRGKRINSEENDQTIAQGDILLIKGSNDSVERLLHTDGLMLTCFQNKDRDFRSRAKTQVEAVLSPRFPGIHKSLGEFDFYRHYGAAVIAVHRSGERITTELHKIRLEVGDNIILLTDNNFIKSWGESSVFYLLSEGGDFIPPSDKKGRLGALIILFLMIVGATLGEKIDSIFINLTGNPLAHYLPALEGVKLDMFYFAAIAAILMAWLKLFPHKKYTKFISWDILIAIASAFAISRAMINSGISTIIANYIIDISSSLGGYGIIAILYVITNITTEVVTNNAAAALTFPIALAVASQLGVDPMPFFVVITIAASASFSSPIGYQTNLIVQSVGNYKFKDYIKIGLPLNIIAFIISTIIIPLIWKF